MPPILLAVIGPGCDKSTNRRGSKDRKENSEAPRTSCDEITKKKNNKFEVTLLEFTLARSFVFI